MNIITSTSSQQQGSSNNRMSLRRRMKSFHLILYLKHFMTFRNSIGILCLCGVIIIQWKFNIVESYDNDNDNDNDYYNYNSKTKVQVQNQLEQRIFKQYHSLVCTEDNNDFMKYNKRYFTTIKDPNNINNNQKYIATTKTNPSFFVSLNNKKYDKIRWDIMTYGLYYERILSNNFIEIIQQNQQQQNQNQQQQNQQQPIIVMDVGSNVGWFSLLSASMGSNVHVYSFEATPIHLLRLCESLVLNNWTTATATTAASSSSSSSRPIVNLYNYAVGANPNGRVQFIVPDIGNPGVGSVATALQAQAHNKELLHTVNMLSLDGFAIDQGWLQPPPREPTTILQSSFSSSSRKKPTTNNNTTTTTTSTIQKISILKIDVERYELEVIKGSNYLLQSKIVENIFLELGLRDESTNTIQLVNRLINDYNYYLYKWGIFRGPDNIYEYGTNTTKIIENFIFNSTFYTQPGHQAINTWWKLK